MINHKRHLKIIASLNKSLESLSLANHGALDGLLLFLLLLSGETHLEDSRDKVDEALSTKQR